LGGDSAFKYILLYINNVRSGATYVKFCHEGHQLKVGNFYKTKTAIFIFLDKIRAVDP